MIKGRTAAFIVLAVFLALAVCLPAGAAGEKKADVKNGTPVIDGVVDEVWSYADALPIDVIKTSGDSPNDGTGAKGSFKLLWDSGRLYVLAEIKDSTRNNTGTATYTVDGIELFLDPLHTVSETYEEGNNFRFTVTADGQFGIESTDKTDCVEYKVTDGKDGYVVELAIAIASPVPSFKFAAGTVLGFELQLNDNIDGGSSRNHCLGWNDTANEAWQNPTYLGELKLTDVKAQAEAAPAPVDDGAAAPVTAAPKTSDGTAVYVFLVLAAGCAMTVLVGRKSKS